jgi:predicted dithiol-disulfide oxidoreductase (DUF899 family)
LARLSIADLAVRRVVTSPGPARGTEQADGTYGLLDLTALGRQEEREEPKGRAAKVYPPDPRLFLTDW